MKFTPEKNYTLGRDAEYQVSILEKEMIGVSQQMW